MEAVERVEVMRTYKIISADGHLDVPMDLWIHRIPEKHRAVMPKLIPVPNMPARWRIEAGGQSWERAAPGIVGDWDYDQQVPSAIRYYEPDGSPRPGTGGAVQRLYEQDRDGIDAEVLFPPNYSPTFFRHHGLRQVDPEAYQAFIHGYNDWMSEEFCSVAPDRLIGMGMLPESGLDDAIAEMARCKDMGLRGVTLATWPNGGPHYEPDDDRFFAASLDLDMRLCPHVSFGSPRPVDPVIGGLVKDTLLAAGGSPTYAIGQLIVYGVFDRFPALRIYFAETQAGWLAHHLSWQDEFFRRWNHHADLHLPRLPSEYYRDQTMFSFIVDNMAMKLRKYIGLEMLMWGSDFPHSVGSFPDSLHFLEQHFEDCTEEERYQVLVGNPCQYFGLDPTKELTPTPERSVAGT
jgi:uncharacterized protein